MVDATFSIIEDEKQRNELQIFYADNYRHIQPLIRSHIS